MHDSLEKDILIRKSLDSDKNFIYSTWLNGLRYGNPVYEFIDKDSYFKNYQKVIDAILNSSTILVACFHDAQETILGYSVLNHETMHWIFVKPAWRKLGIATALMPKEFTIATHITNVGKAIMIDKYPNAIFDPFQL